jgi:hypothetical protein
MAARHGCVDAVRELLSHRDIDVNARDVSFSPTMFPFHFLRVGFLFIQKHHCILHASGIFRTSFGRFVHGQMSISTAKILT